MALVSLQRQRQCWLLTCWVLFLNRPLHFAVARFALVLYSALMHSFSLWPSPSFSLNWSAQAILPLWYQCHVLARNYKLQRDHHKKPEMTCNTWVNQMLILAIQKWQMAGKLEVYVWHLPNVVHYKLYYDSQVVCSQLTPQLLHSCHLWMWHCGQTHQTALLR